MTTAALETPSTLERSLAGKYLTFALGDGAYGLPVLQVREIFRHTPVTPVPQMPDYVKGVLNLRGKVIPITDLRRKLGLARAKTTERTCIVVVQVRGGDGALIQTGLVVDAVQSVAALAAKDIEPTPDFGAQCSADFISGMAKLESSVVALLDLDRVMAHVDTDSEAVSAR